MDMEAVGNWAEKRNLPYAGYTDLAQKPEVLLNCADEESEQRMKAEVDAVLRTGDTVGGIFEVVAHNVPPGLGTYANWDERLDSKLAAAVMSIQAVKGVEIGDGVQAAASHGSAAQDEIGYAHSGEAAGTLHSKFTQFTRAGNHAGGLEGGISNGCDVVVRGHLKPISTLRRPLGSVDFASREPVKAAYERSDVCAVPAGGVVGEAMVALVLAQAALEKFGGDSLAEMRRNYEGYCEQLRYY
jgi:chorismate synthase